VIPKHISWFEVLDELQTTEGHSVTVCQLNHINDEDVWSDWARHYRNHYCSDDEIDGLKAGTPFEESRSLYLISMVFPDSVTPPGPSVRSGDFAEILVADFLQYLLEYWVPRTQYAEKAVRNESVKGTDIVGFKFTMADCSPTSSDEMVTFESKAQMTGTSTKPLLQTAIDDARKDKLRKAETLNAVKRRLLVRGRHQEAAKVQRFQRPLKDPYLYRIGAAGCYTLSLYDDLVIKSSTSNGEPDMLLLIIKAADLANVVSRIYEVAANEA
jgi:hypothetical protein